MKHYLFWEKQSIKEFWEKGLFLDKVFMITYSILMLFFFVVFIVMSLSTDSPLFTGMLLGVLWIVIFLGTPFLGHVVEKSYWVIFEDTWSPIAYPSIITSLGFSLPIPYLAGK